MKMYDRPESLEKYLNIELKCSCGKTHYAPIKAVNITSGALNALPELLHRFGYCKPFIVCDEITYKIAGERCMKLLDDSGFTVTAQIIRHSGYDEATLGELVINMPVDCDLIIAVGTGSISDMVRYMSFKLRLPSFTVATAAPMDGFAASIGVMNVNNLKTTMQAKNTEVIIGDTDILENAPYRMSAAGFGDLIGKITCINDWELSRIVNGEHYCERIAALVKNCVNTVLAESRLLKQRDAQALGKVMNGLVLSGTAISLYGDSRPASGAEHHMSHYWETIGDQRGTPFAMHGEQVAVATVLILMLIEELLEETVDFEKARQHALSFNKEKWEKEIRCVYGSAAQEIIKLEEKAKKNDPQKQLERIETMQSNWEEIRAQLETVPSSKMLKNALIEAGCPTTPAEIGIDRELLIKTFVYCKEVRARYTVLQTVYDLGLLETLANKVADKLENGSLAR